MATPEPRVAEATRRAVVERARNCCEYCLSQARFSPAPFSLEHIVPRAEGGSSDIMNLAWACMGCNGHKHSHAQARDPVTGELVRLFHPRRDVWAEHFGWSEDFTYIIGLTPIGRATVARLQLNRTGVVNLRKTLVKLGLHPP